MEETLRNFEANQPYQQIGQYNNYLIKEPIWSHQEQLDVISGENMFVYSCLRGCHEKALITDNFVA